ncbi:MAG: hypothetical protein DMG97_05325 [Acidobacteria bacterium]|nr:MAG: hypothetical protein DMG97_05325 [Acidobacteriota bacterium]
MTSAALQCVWRVGSYRPVEKWQTLNVLLKALANVSVKHTLGTERPVWEEDQKNNAEKGRMQGT